MASRRCTLCGINYPDRLGFDTCPVHGSETDYSDKPASTDWEKESGRMLKQFEADEEARIMGPILDVAVVVREQGFFVNAWDVYDANGGKVLYRDGLFRVGKMTFEVLEYLEDRTPPEYWVRPLETTFSDEGLDALLGGG